MLKKLLPVIFFLFVFLFSTTAEASAGFITKKCVRTSGNLVKIYPDNPELMIQSRVASNVRYLVHRFKVTVVESFSRHQQRCYGRDIRGYGWPKAHVKDSWHHQGLAVDIVAGESGWNGVDRLVKYLRRHKSKYSEILYNGFPGHGRGDHLHIAYR